MAHPSESRLVPPSSQPPSVPKKVLFAILTTLLIGVVVEGGARLAWGEPPPFDLLQRVGQCGIELGEETSHLVCSGPDQVPRAFPTRPTDGRPRVVFLGGSSVVEPRGNSFPNQLERGLPEIEVLNLGASGLGAAGVARLASQLAPLAPDLVVIYTGHNDWSRDVFYGRISATRLWLLPVYRLLSQSWVHGLVARRARGQARGARLEAYPLLARDTLAFDVRDQVVAAFRADLTLAVESSPAPVMLLTLLRNPDFPPTGAWSERPETCEPVLFVLGTPLVRPEQKLRQAQDACGPSSVTSFWESRALRARGELEAAEAAWGRSLELDAVPLRASFAADEVIREVGEQTGSQVVDLDEAVGAFPPGSWFADTLHLNPRGTAQVAEILREPVLEAVSSKTP